MLQGKAHYDYIIRKRDLFFTQRNTYSIFLGDLEGTLNFDYSMTIDAIDTVALEIANLSHFDSDFDIYPSDTTDLSLTGADHFDGDVLVDSIDNADIELPESVIRLTGEISTVPIDIKGIKFEYENHFGSEMSLIVFDLAEMMFDITTHFESNFTAEGVTYQDLTILGESHLEASVDAAPVTFNDLELEYIDYFEGDLGIVMVYTYGLIFDEILNHFEGSLELDQVTYHDIDGTITSQLTGNIDLDSVELIQDSYLIEMHLESVLVGTTVSVIDLSDFETGIHLESEFEANTVETIYDAEIEGETHFSAKVVLEFIAGYIYPEFDQYLVRFGGYIDSMYLMRDRLLNDEEYFNLSVSTFLDLSIEDLLEIEV